MGAALEQGTPPTAADLLAAGERLLDKVLGADCDSRSSALDLLTVDALLTRALEEAAKDPELVAGFAERAMERIASRRRD
jgi:hypothetical protein